MTTTQAGQKLVDWMDSAMRPLEEFGFESIAEAVAAIEDYGPELVARRGRP